MSQNFDIALSHAVLAGMGIYCLTEIKDQQILCAHITYGIIALNNLIQVWNQCVNYNYRFEELYKFTSYLQSLFALPCITTTVWLRSGYSKDWSWAWAVVPIYPLTFYLIKPEVDLQFIGISTIFNLFGLGFVSLSQKNHFGVATTTAYFLSYCYSGWVTICNYGLSVFAYCSLRTIE